MNIKELKAVLEKFQPNEVLINAPTRPHSYRGYYEQLAFERSGEDSTVGEFLRLLESCVGKTFTGYKGGDFTMGLNTTVNIAFYGSTGGEIQGIICSDYGLEINAPAMEWY